MALSTEEKRKYLTLQGKNPDEFDVDDTTLEVVPKIKVQPAAASNNGFTQSANVVTPKPLDTFARNAATGIVPALAGAGAWALAAPFAPATGGASLLIPLAASIGASIGTHKLQEKVLESTEGGKEFLQKTAEGNQLNPKSAVAGNIAASLPIMRPSVGMLKDAAKGLVGHRPGELLKAVARNPAASNVALGTAMGTGQGIYDEIADPNELNIGRLGLNIAGGVLMNKPANNPIARAVGIHPYVRDPRLGDYEGGIQIDKVVPKPTGGSEINPADVYSRERGTLNVKKRETIPDKEIGLKGYRQTEVPQDIARMEAEGGVIPKDEAYNKELEEVKLEQRKLDEQIQEAARQKQLDYERGEVQRKAAELKDILEAGQITPSTTKGVNPQRTYTKGVERANTEVVQESPAELQARQLEGYTTDKYATGGQEKVSKTAKQEMVKVPDEEVIGNRAKDLGARHGIQVETVPGESFTSKDGRNVRGLYDPTTRTAKVTTKQEDIGGHEVQHGIIGDLPEPIKQRFFKAVDKHEVAQKWFAKEKAAGRNPDQEEFLAQAGGEEDIRRIRQRDSNLWRDITAWYRVHVSKKGTGDDVVRWLTNRMTYARTAPKTEGGIAGRSGIKEGEGTEGTIEGKKEVLGDTTEKGEVLRNSDVGQENIKVNPFDQIRKDLNLPEKSTPEQRAAEIANTKNKDQDGKRYRMDARYSDVNQNKLKKIMPKGKPNYTGDGYEGSPKEPVFNNVPESLISKKDSDRYFELEHKRRTTGLDDLDKTELDSLRNKFADSNATLDAFDEAIDKFPFPRKGETLPEIARNSDVNQQPIFSRIAKSTGKEFKSIVDNEFDGAFTRQAVELGRNVKTREELNQLINHAEAAKEEFRKAIASKGDMQEIVDLGAKSQFFNEAIGAATGTGSAGEYLRKKLGSEYKPPFPNEKASEVGQERILYHGSPSARVEKFDKKFAGKSTGEEFEQNKLAHFLSEDKEYATQFAQKLKRPLIKNDKGLYETEPHFVGEYKVKGKIKDAIHLPITNDEQVIELIKKAKAEGFDGVKFGYIRENTRTGQELPKKIEYAVFDSDNIQYIGPSTKADGSRYSEINTTPTDIDTSRKSFLGSFFEPTFDAVSRVSKDVSEAFYNWETRRDQYLGSRNVALNDLSKFTPEQIEDTYKYHRAMFRGEKPAGNVNEEISRILKTYFRDIREKQIEAGLTIHGREAGKNEWYVPDMLSDKAIHLFTHKAGSPEALNAKRDWIAYLESRGEKNANKIVSEYISALGAKRDNYLSVNFGALRKAIGMGLPEQLREANPTKAISKYGRRAAADLALFQELESRPEIASKLKLKDPRTGGIPASEDTSKDISQSNEVRKAMKWVMNSFEASTNPQITSVVRTVNNALLGAATGVRDIVSVPVNALPYVTKFSDLGVFWRGMRDLRQSASDSLKYAARQKNLDELHWQELLDSPDRWSATFNKLSDALRKYQGRELLEQASRIYTFGIGKELAAANLARAQAGDSQAKAWLEKFGRIAKEEGDSDLSYDLNQVAKNFVDRVQGTYGGRGLPTFTMEGGFAPFTALQKWGIEKSNVIYQDVVKPAISGQNYVPFLSYTLGTILTGASIQELNKLLTGRKPQEADIKETIAKGNAQNYVAELTTLMQLGSFAGIVGDLVKAASDVGIRGKTPRNLVSFPTATLAADTAEKLGDVSEALAQGENGFEVLKAFALDVLSSHIQNVRIVSNYTWKKDDVNRSEKFRDLRVFKQLEGKRGSEVPTGVNKYLNTTEKDFKQTDSPAEAMELLPKLADKILQKANDNPEEAIKYIQNLKGNSYQTMPSPEKLPMEFLRYWEFLKETQGESAAQERIIDYIRQREVNKVKGQMLG